MWAPTHPLRIFKNQSGWVVRAPPPTHTPPTSSGGSPVLSVRKAGCAGRDSLSGYGIVYKYIEDVMFISNPVPFWVTSDHHNEQILRKRCVYRQPA